MSVSDAGTYQLKLYVTGQNPRSEQAISTLRRICEQLPPGRSELTVIDVLEQPQLAEDERILATPTVIRFQPRPPRRVIGDLGDMEKVLQGLDLPRVPGASFNGPSSSRPE